MTYGRHDVIQTQQHIIMVIEYAGNELFEHIVKHGKVALDQLTSNGLVSGERGSALLSTNHVCC